MNQPPAHPWSGDVPVLVMAFNRPDHLATLLNRLREVNAQRIYVAIDGPRPDRPEEAAAVTACRQLAAGIDWASEVYTHFREDNLGCGRGVTDNITWFFSQVSGGIILEDDVIPVPDFFPFCTELLERYRDDPRVFAISGANHVPRDALTWPDAPYRFSEFTHVWGWATWRRSWVHHEFDCSNWRKRVPFHQLLARNNYSLRKALYWATNWELTARGEVDTWDYQVTVASMEQNAFAITSNVNLVENIGFGENATHTFSGDSGLMPTGTLNFPLAHVPMELDRRAAHWTMIHHCKASVVGAVDRIRHYYLDRR